MAESIKAFFSSLTLERLIPAIIISIVGVVAIRILLKLFTRAIRKSKLETGMHTFLRQMLQVLLYFILILIVAESLGINTTSLVAVLSVGSLALSLSVQNTLKNVVGGISVLSTHPFRTGDFVDINGDTGTVTAISMTYTVLLTPENKRVYIPNSDTAAARIINYSEEGTRRVELHVSASYDAPTKQVLQALQDAAARVETKLDSPAVECYIEQYADSSIQYILRYWCNSSDYTPSYFNGMEKIKDVFDERNIEMTYPHLNVHLPPHNT